jgi:hypothetical protein
VQASPAAGAVAPLPTQLTAPDASTAHATLPATETEATPAAVTPASAP